jgi:hypothetical protein
VVERQQEPAEHVVLGAPHHRHLHRIGHRNQRVVALVVGGRQHHRHPGAHLLRALQDVPHEGAPGQVFHHLAGQALRAHAGLHDADRGGACLFEVAVHGWAPPWGSRKSGARNFTVPVPRRSR